MKSLRTMVLCLPLPVVLVAIAATHASAATTTTCRGTFQTLGSYAYTDSDLTVTHTTCAAGKKLAQKVPAYRVLKPRHVDGYRCTAVSFAHGIRGGYQAYTCRKGAATVKWHVSVPSEV
jgi:hypothetical protein